MSDLTDQDLIAIRNATMSAGLDLSKVRPVNPFSLESPTAKGLQMAIEGIDPMAAARLRQSAGISANLEATMAARGLIDHTPATKAELRAHDPEFLREEQQQAVAGYEAQLKWLESEGERAVGQNRGHKTRQRTR